MDGLGTSATPEQVAAYEVRYAEALTPTHRAALRYLGAVHAAGQRVTWMVRSLAPGEEPSDTEALAVRFGAVLADELRRLA